MPLRRAASWAADLQRRREMRTRGMGDSPEFVVATAVGAASAAMLLGRRAAENIAAEAAPTGRSGMRHGLPDRAGDLRRAVRYAVRATGGIAAMSNGSGRRR